MAKRTSNHGKRQGGILPKFFGIEIAVRWENRMRCVRVVVVVVVMNDVVGGERMSKIRHLSALWYVLCSSLDKAILGKNATRAVINKNVSCVPHIFGDLFHKR